MRRLSIHLNRPAGYALDWLVEYRPDYALLIFCDLGDYPVGTVRKILAQGTRIIARWYPGMEGWPAGHPAEFANLCRQIYDRYGIADFVAQNEPVITTPQEMRAFSDWQREWAERLGEMGLHAWVGNFSVGNPPRLEDLPAFAPALLAAVWSGGGLAYHAYGWPTIWEPSYEWYAGRASRILYHIGLDAPVVLTEAGLDGGVAGKGGHGWRSACSAEEYFQMLVDWDKALPPNVRAVCLFNYGCYDDWRDFELTEDLARLIGAYIKGQGQMGNWTVRPDDSATLRLWRRDRGGDIETVCFAHYIPRVVGAEVGRYWPIEALKAQAVAARSYAAYWVARGGKHPGCDLCTEPCCQVYREHTGYPQSTYATTLTDSQVLFKFGTIYQAQYVSRCGRPDCPLCQGHGGHKGQTWWGRLCQEGAKYMAEHGSTYEDILKKYYGAVEIRRAAGGIEMSVVEILLGKLDDMWKEKPRYNPTTALARAARKARLGLPVSEEGRETAYGVTYALQFFRHGMVYCREGDWGNVQVEHY